MATKFLTGAWQKLLMANYEVPKEVLLKYLPYGTEIDLWNDTCYVSLIGFFILGR